jgi:hypothetical protein
MDLLLAGLAREETAELYYLFSSLHGIANSRVLYSDYENLGKYIHFCVKNIMAFSVKALKLDETVKSTRTRLQNHVAAIDTKFAKKKEKLKKWRKLTFLWLQNPPTMFNWVPQIREMFDSQDTYRLKLDKQSPEGSLEKVTQGFMTGQIILILWDSISQKMDGKANKRNFKFNSSLGSKKGTKGDAGGKSSAMASSDTSDKQKVFNYLKTFLQFCCFSSENVYGLGTSTQANRKVKSPNNTNPNNIPEKINPDDKILRDKLTANLTRRFPPTPAASNSKLALQAIPNLDPFFDVFKDNKDLADIKECFPVIQSLMKFYLMISTNEYFKSPNILWEALMKMMEFAENYLKKCSADEAKFIKTILSLLTGADFNGKIKKTKDGTIKYPKISASDAGTYFFDHVIKVAFKQLNPKTFNIDKIKVMMNISGLIQKDFLNNTKNPGRLEEIIEVILNSIASLIPGFNEEVATAISDLSFGRMEGLKTLIVHHLTNEAQNLKKAGGKALPKGAADDVNSVEEGPSGNVPKATQKVKVAVDSDDESGGTKAAAMDTGKNNPHLEKANKVFGYLGDAKGMLDFSSLKAKLPTGGGGGGLSNQVDPETWNGVLKKIQSGEVKPADIFHILNRYGGGKGSINPTSFKLLAGRLGIQLSDHRIGEIFAKVKGGKITNPAQMTLNPKEFEKAMVYLMEKSLLLAMDSMGISSEQLGVLLMFLVLMLILVFIFIFVGIGAFALGGTFGSVVNSAFPALGGGSVGKESDGDKNKLNPEAIAQACQQAVDIIKSAVHGGAS